MVVFTCNHCGDSLQKPKVAKHYQTTCSRNPIALTCVDCFKDFNLQEYVAHTKCMTEEHRYSAKGTVAKVQKGEAKQSEWVETVNSIIEEQKNAKPAIRNILQAMVNYTNIPRKKAKFINFMNNAFRKFNMRDIEEVWNILEAHKNQLKEKQNSNKTEEKQENGTSAEKVENGTSEEKVQNGTSENGTSEGKSKKKKRKNKTSESTEQPDEEVPEKKQKLDETNEDTSSKKKKKKKTNQPETTETEQAPETNGNDAPVKTKKKKTSETNEETNNSKLEENQNEKFNFKQVIIEILTKKSKGLTKDALENKVSKKFETMVGPIENKEGFLKKYNKKLKALKNVTFDNDKYKIVSE